MQPLTIQPVAVKDLTVLRPCFETRREMLEYQWQSLRSVMSLALNCQVQLNTVRPESEAHLETARQDLMHGGGIFSTTG